MSLINDYSFCFEEEIYVVFFSIKIKIKILRNADLVVGSIGRTFGVELIFYGHKISK